MKINLCTYKEIPVFQNKVYNSIEQARNCVTGNIHLVEDLETGLVYNDAFSSELMNYDSNYNNEQALSPMFKAHLESVLDLINSYLGNENLVEVGCGKGFFLELLQSRGFEIVGFDPAYEGNNPTVEQKFFEKGVGIKADGLILRHVLEHVENPVEFLECLKEANQDSGLIYIEVPCFDWICEHNAWFDILYEHVNYFRLGDFKRIFSNVVESGRLFGGQYLYVIADLSSLKKPVRDISDPVAFPRDFMLGVEKYKSTHLNVKKAIWGGASKGVLFGLLQSRVGNNFDMVIDINPAKQEKFMPLTGVKVYSPEEGLDILPSGSPIYVMNGNYLEEVKEMSNNNYNYVSIDR
ncbi:MAG: class I SAM-dependent methyltransferase [Gammaproteobacteria bacterium]|nr:class I SAM-dependent methyltransferase [Gammaproteobacteria bacterium]